MSTPNRGMHRVYEVRGMTCEHCASSVIAQVEALAGVSAATVDIAAGTLTVRGESIKHEAVRAAVSEAGYEVVAA